MEISVRDRIVEMIEFNYAQPSGFNHDERIKWGSTIDTLLDEHIKTTNEKILGAIERLNKIRNAAVFADSEAQITAMFHELDEATKDFT